MAANEHIKQFFLQQIAPQPHTHKHMQLKTDFIIHWMYATNITWYYCAAKMAITLHTKEREMKTQRIWLNNTWITTDGRIDDESKIVSQLKPSSVSRLNVEHQLNESECEHFALYVHTCMCVMCSVCIAFHEQVLNRKNGYKTLSTRDDERDERNCEVSHKQQIRMYWELNHRLNELMVTCDRVPRL